MPGNIVGVMAGIVPKAVKRVIPAAFKARVCGFIFRVTGNADLAFRQASLLRENGNFKAAIRVYEAILNSTGASNDERFRAGYALWEYGESPVEDPLFSCSITNLSTDSNRIKFDVKFVHAGLWISVKLMPVNIPGSIEKPDLAWIRLDGAVLRRQRLLWAEGGAEFQFVVKRRTLDRFPIESCLWLEGETESGAMRQAWGKAKVMVPHGDGTLPEKIALLGPLDKKGGLSVAPDALLQRQDAFLNIYMRANAAFMEEFGRPLFLLYGTLLGQCRNGDFIPGDDDFDVGYVSNEASPTAVKHEVIEIMRFFVRAGFKVLVNRFGKPFRLTDMGAGAGIHLDVRPVWAAADRHVWMHKMAHLDMSLDGFRAVTQGRLRDVPVWCPHDANRFLELYYGPSWRVPDPGFSNSGKVVPEAVRKGLEACCLTAAEQRRLLGEVQRMRAREGATGDFVPIGLEPLYPLHIYQERVAE